MLTEEQQASYDRDGYLIVCGAIPTDACERMCDRLWEALTEAHGIRRDDEESWTRAMPRGLQKPCKADAFAEEVLIITSAGAGCSRSRETSG